MARIIKKYLYTAVYYFIRKSNVRKSSLAGRLDFFFMNLTYNSLLTDCRVGHNLFFNNSPLEQFEVTNLLSVQFPIFGYFTLSITNLALYSILVLLVTL